MNRHESPQHQRSLEASGAAPPVSMGAIAELPFESAVRSLAVGGVIGVAFSAALVALIPQARGSLEVRHLVAITLGSMGVAVVALTPGIVSIRLRSGNRFRGGSEPVPTNKIGELGEENVPAKGPKCDDDGSGDDEESQTRSGRLAWIREGFMAEFVISVLLRLVGTVALFMLCRYQLPASEKFIAAWVLCWYGWLSLMEVISLCRSLQQTIPADR